ncbi:MAG: hypothetical protein ACOCZ7_02785, partial [Armatimonadota bacterium]
DAAEAQLAEAVDVMLMMVRSARVNERVADQRTERLRDLVERAQRALASIPAELQPEPIKGPVSAIGGTEAGASAATWAMPDHALGYWSEQAGDGDAVNSIDAPVESRPAN